MARKKTLISRETVRKTVTELVSRMINTNDPRMGLVAKMEADIEAMDKASDRFKARLELLKFVCPQMSSIKVEQEDTGAPLTKIVFQRAEPHDSRLKAVPEKD
ncbi:MAG: hypothetical protein ACOH5I_21950 [Oligoflexus sp.]